MFFSGNQGTVDLELYGLNLSILLSIPEIKALDKQTEGQQNYLIGIIFFFKRYIYVCSKKISVCTNDSRTATGRHLHLPCTFNTLLVAWSGNRIYYSCIKHHAVKASKATYWHM